MQFMLTLFGRVLHVSIGLENVGDDTELVCVSGGEFDIANEDDSEGAKRQIGFGKQHGA